MNTPIIPNLIGQQFQDFLILECIGRGAMGSVYRAMQLSLDREIALKIIAFDLSLRGNEESWERLQREAKLAASLQHPNIVAVYSAGWWEQHFYIAMEYIAGQTLQKRITQGRLPEPMVWDIALQLCDALECAASRGIIHRDIKPANILLTDQGIPKLADFGLSKRHSDPGMTRDNVILGTPSYMSPEQVACKPVDLRSDMYCLGATLYHAITGVQVFQAENITDLMYMHRYEMPLPPEKHVTEISSEGSKILLKLLEKSPDHRYANYSQLKSAIRLVLAKLKISSGQVPRMGITRKLLSPFRALFQKSPSEEVTQDSSNTSTGSSVGQSPTGTTQKRPNAPAQPTTQASSSMPPSSDSAQPAQSQGSSHQELPATIMYEDKESTILTEYGQSQRSQAQSESAQNQTTSIVPPEIHRPKTPLEKAIIENNISPARSLNPSNLAKNLPANTSSISPASTNTSSISPASTNTSSISMPSATKIWQILVSHPDQIQGEQWASALNSTGKFMTVSVMQEHDVVMLLEIELFHVYIYLKSASESSEIPLHESIQHIFPQLYQIMIDSNRNFPNAGFFVENKIAFVPEFDLITILQIIERWQSLESGISNPK